MRIGVISDAHGNIEGLEAALDGLGGTGRVFFLGDSVGYYPFPNEVIARLREAGVECLAGNHDAMITGRLPVDPERAEAYNLPLIRSLLTEENLEWLRRLPSSRELWLGGRRILMCHGSPWDPLEEYIYPDFDGFERFAALDYDLVLLGHTHWPLVRRRGRTLVVNPGSCGQPRDRVPGASYARVDLDEMEAELRRADFEPYRLLAEAQLLGLPPKLIEYFGRPS